MMFRFWMFALSMLTTLSPKLHAICLPSETKNIACVVLDHTSPVMKTGKDVLELSKGYEKLAHKMSEKILNGHHPLHPVVKEALKGSHTDIYVLRLLCAKNKTFMTDKDSQEAQEALPENEPTKAPK